MLSMSQRGDNCRAEDAGRPIITMTQPWGEFVQALNDKLMAQTQRLGQLQELLHSMQQSEVFHADELSAAACVIEICESDINEIRAKLESKITLYETKVCELETVLAQRHAVLQKFDTMLESESQLSKTLIEYHSQLESRLCTLDKLLQQV
jgi:hypothetical protein